MSKEIICRNCGYQGKAKKTSKGSIWIEIVLWCCILLPGLIYSIWRLTSKYLACPKCGSKDLVPLDSPVGQKLLKEQSH